jgi:hypothetical protein
MIITFKYGIEHEGFYYGWFAKELYRLPSTSGRYTYGIRKLKQIIVGNQLGYRLKKDKFSMKQLYDRTVLIPKVEISLFDYKNRPF